MAQADLPPYVVAICIILPVVILILLCLLLFIFCSKKYKLNWFERNLLEQEQEKQTIIHSTYSTNGSTGSRKNSAVKFKEDHHSPATPFHSRRKSSIFQYSPLTEPRGNSQEDEFWVPPAVLERKRGQSVVTLASTSSPCHESEEGSIFSPDYHSQLSIGSQSPAHEFGSITTVPQQQRRGRRASMHEAIDHTKLDTAMYKKLQLQRQWSMSKSEDESMGSVNFKLDYKEDTGLFTVRLIQVKDLPVPDRNETMDPYCRVRVYSDAKGQHQHTQQTKVVKNEVNPEFDEEFLFEVLPELLPHTTLEVCVYNYDAFSQDEVVGIMRLNVINVDYNANVTLWKNLVSPDVPHEELELGRLMFSMAHLSSAERLTIVILKARNLKDVESSSDDVHVKVAVFQHSRKTKKKKTSSKHGPSPVWNEALVFSVSKESLKEATVEISVIHENRLETNEVVGRVLLGVNCRPSDGDYWNDVIHGKSTLARWHNLTL